MNALALDRTASTLFIGGLFDTIGFPGASVIRYGIAALHTSGGTAFPFTFWDTRLKDTVNALALDSSTGILYAGGPRFWSTLAPSDLGGIVALNTMDALNPVIFSWNPYVSGTVNAVALNGTTLYIGGSFTTDGASSRNYLAALDTIDGDATAWNPAIKSGTNYAVDSLAVLSDRVYAGGSFIQMGTPAAPQAYLAQFDGSATLVELAYFRARVCSSSKVRLAWKTYSEIDTAGFNILRSDAIDGAPVQVNTALIPAKDSTTMPITYSHMDANLPMPGATCSYILQEVDCNGTATTYGPVSVKAPGAETR